MNNIKTLIRSSIISLIIVTLGLFIVCIGRAPKLNVDGPLIEGRGTESEANEFSDKDFSSLLESTDNEIIESDSTESEPIIFEDDQTVDSSEEDLAEILQLLNLEEENGTSDSEMNNQVNNNLWSQEETADSSSSDSTDIISDFESEIDKLEQALQTRNSQLDSIQKEINGYDEKIAELETTLNGAGGGKMLTYASYKPVRQAAPVIKDRSFNTASSFREQYDKALNYFHNRRYRSAILAFDKLLQENPYHALADNCQYWIGECQYARGNYYQAIVEFEKVFSFDAPDKRDDAQIMMGLAYMKLGESNQANQDFSWLITCYRTSEYYQRAQRYKNELYLK